MAEAPSTDFEARYRDCTHLVVEADPAGIRRKDGIGQELLCVGYERLWKGRPWQDSCWTSIASAGYKDQLALSLQEQHTHRPDHHAQPFWGAALVHTGLLRASALSNSERDGRGRLLQDPDLGTRHSIQA